MPFLQQRDYYRKPGLRQPVQMNYICTYRGGCCGMGSLPICQKVGAIIAKVSLNAMTAGGMGPVLSRRGLHVRSSNTTPHSGPIPVTTDYTRRADWRVLVTNKT